MLKDRFKYDMAVLTARAFAETVPELFQKDPQMPIFRAEDIYERIEKPKNPEMGNFALPLFEFARLIKGNPNELNQRLTDFQNRMALADPDLAHLTFSAAGGFNNCRIKTAALAEAVLREIFQKKNDYGASDMGMGKNIVIDYSSPNIAKPFGVAHLRTTAIGHSLYRIFKKMGYNCIGVNHLGDWGTQFGKLIVAYRLWGSEEELRGDPIGKLLELYVRYHKEEESDSSLTDAARAAFKALEDGHPEETELWEKFRDYSITAFEKTYRRLGIKFDHYSGESFYNDKIEPALSRLEKAGLLEMSQGALTVNLDKYHLPPCLLRRSDGATLYATRDVAAVLYRWETFHFEKALYVVASAQRDHFQQVFKVIELLDEAEKHLPEEKVALHLVHVDFGWIKFQDDIMSTRKGNIVFLEDVLDRAAELAREKIVEKNPELPDIDKISRMIGHGAVIFGDLASRRQKDINFVWSEVLNFEGGTGPYLQYTHARLSSLIRKYNRDIGPDVDFKLLDNPEESRVLDMLYHFPQIVYDSAREYEPFIICSYLLELGSAFNRVYQRKDADGRSVKIISDDSALSSARMALVASVRTVINEGLHLLGIESPEEM